MNHNNTRIHTLNRLRRLQSVLLTLPLAVSTLAAANFTGVNFSGDPSLAATQDLAPTDSAGFVPQKFWNNAPGSSGQTSLDIDGGSTIPVFFSGFTAQWQAPSTGSAPGSSPLPNARLMRGSLVSTSVNPILVQFSGIPISYSSVGYALLVYCDSPQNDADVVIKATLQAGATVRTLHLRDAANTDFSGIFSRAALTASTGAGSDTPAGNLFIFTGLNATDVSVAIEPGASNPNAIVSVSAAQLVPTSLLPALAPRITSPLSVTTELNVAFSYTVQTDVPATSYQASGLPDGLSFNSTTGVISGNPTVTGRYMVTLRAAAAAGETSETLVIDVVGTAQTTLQLYMVPAVLIHGVVGERHQIEYANELSDTTQWTPVSTVTLTNHMQFYVDLSATNAPKRFYRARLVP